MAEADFPVSVTFERDGSTTIFDSSTAVMEWQKAEVDAWRPLVANPPSNFMAPLQRNLSLIEQRTNQQQPYSPAELQQSIAKQYISAQGPVGRLVCRLARHDPIAAQIAFFAYLDPNLQLQGNASFIKGFAVAAVCLTGGDPIYTLEIAKRVSDQVVSLRSNESELIERWESLISKTEEDWNDKIEGYATKAALGAPKEYWERRARRHEKLAATARRSWDKWTAIVVIGAIVGAAILFHEIVTGAPSKALEPVAGLTDMLRRVALFGSVLGIAIWWLRQKLRDLRSHEHLAEDADERVTMIETYSALRDKGLETAELTPILSALYRNASTGLVHDDAGAPVLPIEIFTKAVDGAKKHQS